MHVEYQKHRHWLRAVSALLLFALAACGPAKATATPTMSVDAIYTAAYETLMAQQATNVALTPPTSTPAPTEAPTLPPLVLASPIATFAFASPTAGLTGGAGACDSSAFVADVTIPDNSTIDPGKAFTKTWTLLNNGTCTWGTGYQLAFQSGDQMGGVNTALTASVAPGSSINLSVKLTAPSTNGTYKGIWRMQNASNQAFGDTPWVIIKVGAGATAIPASTGTACTTCTITGALATGDTTNFKITFSGATTTPSVTYTDHGFSFTVSSGWSGTITPSKKDWLFNPASITFTNVTTNQNVTFSSAGTATRTPTPTAAAGATP